MARDQKKQDKARRLAARKSGETPTTTFEYSIKNEKPTLKIIPVVSSTKTKQ